MSDLAEHHIFELSNHSFEMHQVGLTLWPRHGLHHRVWLIISYVFLFNHSSVQTKSNACR